MTIPYDYFAKILEERNLTAYKVSQATGLTTVLFTDWKKGKSCPKLDKLMKIADYLDVSVDYLVTGREATPSVVGQNIVGNQNSHNTVTIGGTTAPETLTEYEAELLRIYRQLDVKRKNTLLLAAYDLLEGAK